MSGNTVPGKNNQVTCCRGTNVVPGGGCKTPESINCVYNATCSTGLCSPISSNCGTTPCGTYGCSDNCLGKVISCKQCNPGEAKDPRCAKNPNGECGLVSSLEYGTMCSVAGQTCTPLTSWGTGTSVSKCTGVPTPTPTPTPPGGSPFPSSPPPPLPGTTGWWQVKDGGAVAKGNVRSDAAANGGTLVDSTGSPAVVACGGTSCTSSGDTKWDVASTLSTAALADNSYAEFQKRIGNKVTPQTYSSGLLTTGYYQAESGISLGGPVGDNVVVILVNGTVTITSPISLGNQGLLVIIAKGDISVDPAVNNIQGLFLTDGTFKTGASATPLIIDGSVAALGPGGVSFERTTTGATPAELFVFHPEYLTRLPAGVLRRNQFKEELEP